MTDPDVVLGATPCTPNGGAVCALGARDVLHRRLRDFASRSISATSLPGRRRRWLSRPPSTRLSPWRGRLRPPFRAKEERRSRSPGRDSKPARLRRSVESRRPTWSSSTRRLSRRPLPLTRSVSWDVSVRNPDLEAASLPNAVRYMFGAPPVVSAISPNVGSVGGGTSVTITGTGFEAGATVSIGGVAATAVSVIDGTTITASTGAHAEGTVDVVVTNIDLQSGTLPGGFTHVSPKLTASGASVPGSALYGSGIDVQWTTTNVGATAASTPGRIPPISRRTVFSGRGTSPSSWSRPERGSPGGGCELLEVGDGHIAAVRIVAGGKLLRPRRGRLVERPFRGSESDNVAAAPRSSSPILLSRTSSSATSPRPARCSPDSRFR